MELSKSQFVTVVTSVKAYHLAKAKVDVATKELAHRVDKMKEASQGSGSPEQVLATCDRLMAEEFRRMIDNGEIAIGS